MLHSGRRADAITGGGERWGWGSSIGLGGYGRGDGKAIRIPLPGAAVAVIGAFTGTFVMVAPTGAAGT
ncbi:hypothetical protein ABIB25_001575 [Nakamurella sp. UYEF19]|uniref:hypothetical protein n=1 Tax=Nakamurella sp. UYEF19 TaxID=1756392 RepID=UPI0033969046